MRAVRAPSVEHESEPPSHHDSQKPTAWEIKKFDQALDELKEYREELEEVAKAREQELETVKEAFSELSENYRAIHKRNRDLEEELEEFRKKSKRADDERDERIGKLEAFAKVAAPYVVKEAGPELQKEGAIGAKVVTDESSKSTKRWSAIASFVGVVIATAISTGFAQCNAPKPDPGVTVPNTRPKPAGTGFAGTP